MWAFWLWLESSLPEHPCEHLSSHIMKTWQWLKTLSSWWRVLPGCAPPFLPYFQKIGYFFRFCCSFPAFLSGSLYTTTTATSIMPLTVAWSGFPGLMAISGGLCDAVGRISQEDLWWLQQVFYCCCYSAPISHVSWGKTWVLLVSALVSPTQALLN